MLGKTNIPDSMPGDVARLAGTTLYEIRLGPFHIQFCFLESARFILTVNKRFKFRIDGGAFSGFDASATSHSDEPESTRFVLLNGRRCESATLSPTAFHVVFEGEAELLVEFSDGDFEPIHFTGTSGEPPEAPDFLYVL